MQNPPVPYSGPVTGGFGDGRMVRIQGTAAPTANRININLQTGSQAGADIAVHISVRISEGYIARNSCQHGAWGEEQGQGQLPIGPGQKFEILVLSAATDYKIAINGQHFAEFPHRIPPSYIKHLSIDGDLTLSLISFEGGEEHSKASAGIQQSGAYGMPPHGIPPQGAYGAPPTGYGGPPPGAYGAPPSGAYGAPPAPPGYQAEKEPSGFENILGSAGSLIAGAISSGVADKLINSLTHSASNQPQNQTQQQQQPQFQPQQPHQPPPSQSNQSGRQSPPIHLPMFGGGGSIGNLGSVGSILGNLAGMLQQPKRDGQH